MHQIPEPDPYDVAGPPRLLSAVSSTYYKFPANHMFDAEGLVVRDQQALIITKRRDGQPAEVYRLPLGTSTSFFMPATPERRGVLPCCVEPVTGATLTRDGRRLAVVTDLSVRVYESMDFLDWKPVGATRFQAPDVEAITWDGTDLILVSEDRSIYRVHEGRWRGARRAAR